MKHQLLIHTLVSFLFLIQASTLEAQVLNKETYRVTALKSGDNKVQSVSNMVYLIPDFRVFVPNAFSPNEDKNNEGFGVKGAGIKDFRLQVYTRWGEKIFETSDPRTYWDGTYRGNPSPEGVFIYQLNATGLKGNMLNTSGTITLIR